MKENGFTQKRQVADDIQQKLLLMQTIQMIKNFLQIHMLKAARSINLNVNSEKILDVCFYQDGAIFSLNGRPLRFVNHFTYLGSNISSTESNVIIHIGKHGLL